MIARTDPPSHGTTTLFMTDTITFQMASPRITAVMIRPTHLRVSTPSAVNVLAVWSMNASAFTEIVTHQRLE